MTDPRFDRQAAARQPAIDPPFDYTDPDGADPDAPFAVHNTDPAAVQQRTGEAPEGWRSVEPDPTGAAPSHLGWCIRCGLPYLAVTRPTCECAGDPPIDHSGPAWAAYLGQVRELHYTPDPDAPAYPEYAEKVRARAAEHAANYRDSEMRLRAAFDMMATLAERLGANIGRAIGGPDGAQIAADFTAFSQQFGIIVADLDESLADADQDVADLVADDAEARRG